MQPKIKSEYNGCGTAPGNLVLTVKQSSVGTTFCRTISGLVTGIKTTISHGHQARKAEVQKIQEIINKQIKHPNEGMLEF